MVIRDFGDLARAALARGLADDEAPAGKETT